MTRAPTDEKEIQLSTLLAFIHNLRANPQSIEQIRSGVQALNMDVVKTFSEASSEYHTNLIAGIESLTSETLARGPSRVVAQYPKLWSARELYPYGFEPPPGGHCCQNGQGICIGESSISPPPLSSPLHPSS